MRQRGSLTVDVWTSIISAYVYNKQSDVALQLFEQFKQTCKPNHVTYVSVINACTELKDVETGKRIHQDIIDSNVRQYGIAIIT
jgi:pentatricopeptide repeat protein